MPRGPRLAFAGAVYHVVARGNNREDVFRDDVDRSLYLDLLARAKDSMGVRLLAYVLMSNHVHLVLQTLSPNIAGTIHRIHGRYAVRFNRRHGRSGHLFGSRYDSTPVQEDRHLLEVTRYVHLNPVRAGLVRHPLDYPWSSYREYVEPDARTRLVDPASVLEVLAHDLTKSRAAYREFVLTELAPVPGTANEA